MGQIRMWEEVSRIQQNLADALSSSVASPESRTSLALALENESLRAARRKLFEEDAANDKDRAAATEAAHAAAQEPDTIGYVFAVNGELNSADIYPSAALFHKMWPKLLSAAATEAISARYPPTVPMMPASPSGEDQERPQTQERPAPTVDAVKEFLAAAEAGKLSTWKPDDRAEVAMRDGEHALMFESRGAGGLWVHRNYLAR